MDNWSKDIIESILTNKSFNISEVHEIKFIKSFSGYDKHDNLLSKLLEEKNYKQIDEIDNSEKEFDDITVISFKNHEGQLYYGLVYDSDELWQDPVVMKIFPSNNQGT